MALIIKISRSNVQTVLLLVASYCLILSASAQPKARPRPSTLDQGQVVIIKSIEWRQVKAVLDNANSNSGGGWRIFPEKVKFSDTNSDFSYYKVGLRSQVSATVNGIEKHLQGTKVYFKMFDVDDPSSDVAPLDDDSQNPGGNDNNGYVPLKVVSAITDADGYAEVQITVSSLPGDNYRAAASLEEAELNSLTTKITPNGNNSSYVPPKNDLVNSFTGKVTDMLTVWRHLHIEVDSMTAPNLGTSVPTNIVRGKIIAIDKDDTGYKATFDKDLTNGEDLGTGMNDVSRNLDSIPVANGRFEKGTLTFGSTETLNAAVKANGTNYVRIGAGGMSVPFSLSQEAPNTPKISGFILGLAPGVIPEDPSTLMLDHTLEGANYAGGTIEIAGQTFSVAASGASSVTTVTQVTLPFSLSDDDQTFTGVLPFLPPMDESAWTTLVSLYKPAYLIPVVDGGSEPSNNKKTVAWQPNTSQEDASELSRAIHLQNAQESPSKPDFWVVSVLFAFQPQTGGTASTAGGARGDMDDHNELDVGGVANWDSAGLVVYRDTLAELGSLNDTELLQRLFGHEIGHLFKCPDRYQGGAGYIPNRDGGLMQDGHTPGRVFIDDDLKTIRQGVLKLHD